MHTDNPQIVQETAKPGEQPHRALSNLSQSDWARTHISILRLNLAKPCNPEIVVNWLQNAEPHLQAVAQRLLQRMTQGFWRISLAPALSDGTVPFGPSQHFDRYVIEAGGIRHHIRIRTPFTQRACEILECQP